MAGTDWITGGDGSRPEMDRSRKEIVAGDGSNDELRSEIDRGQIWIATGYRWMTGYGWQEMNHG